MFSTSYQQALDRLQRFLPTAGSSYAKGRNYDFGCFEKNKVSYLSPYLRHRLLAERQVTEATLNKHSLNQAEKFIQEVCWRTYFKGYLENRPMIWSEYLEQLNSDYENLQGYQKQTLKKATHGQTEIECFNDWVAELKSNGYLHNHSRMWFASIWIFTLNLPWTLGADFFMRHLFDGDAASNTLSWRWVAGLHTKGKHYLARASNITKFTDGRYTPRSLNESAGPLQEDFDFDKEPLPDLPALNESEPPKIFLVTEDDLCTQEILDPERKNHFVFLSPEAYTCPYSEAVMEFKNSLIREQMVLAALNDHECQLVRSEKELLAQVGQGEAGWYQPFQGYVNDFIEGLGLSPRKLYRRSWDNLFFPHCTAGFFKVKKQIPQLVSALIAQQESFDLI